MPQGKLNITLKHQTLQILHYPSAPEAMEPAPHEIADPVRPFWSCRQSEAPPERSAAGRQGASEMIYSAMAR